MRIVILGAGSSGFDVSRLLSQRGHDITLVDNNIEVIERAKDTLDVLAFVGESTDPSILNQANVKNADYVLSFTTNDETNIISSMVCKKMGARKVIARIRGKEYDSKEFEFIHNELGIDVILHPEKSVARDIVYLLRQSLALDIISLVNNKIQLVGFRLTSKTPIIKKRIIEYTEENKHIRFRIVAISRQGLTIIPKGNEVLNQHDLIFVLAKTEDIPKVIKSTGLKQVSINRIMISGGTRISRLIVQALIDDHAKNWKIKLIEPNRQVAEKLALEFNGVLVLHGDPTDIDMLASEGITDTDAYIAVSQDQESNIISCLLAKHLGVDKTIALISKADFLPISQTIGLHSSVSIQASITNEIHQHIVRENLISHVTMQGISAEIVEYQLQPTSKLINIPIHKCPIPKSCVIGCQIRNNEINITTGKTILSSGDRIIVFCLPDAIKKIRDLTL